MASTTNGFPNELNTGVPDGVTLTPSGSIIVTKAGTVLKNLDIKGDVYVMAPNVTIENCRITSSSWQGINTNGNADGLVVKNCDIDGQGKVAGSYGILAAGTFIGNDIRGFENGIGVTGNDTIIKGNYIHDLKAPGDPHYDGVAMHGGQSNVLVEGNTISGTDTSDIFIKNDFGPISNVKVNNNYLIGNPGYMVYVDARASGGPITGVSITNNEWEKGVYGYYSVEKSNVTVSGNHNLSPGQAPNPPLDGGNGSTDSGAGTGGTTTPEVPGTGVTSGTVKTITGTEGNDKLPATGVSNAGNEKYYGLGGNDVIEGGAGADHIDGGAGNDTASYASSNAGVNVNLATGKGTGGHAQGDTLVGIENLTGSKFADVLTGDAGANILDGGAGADRMAGGAGDDTYIVDNIGDIVTELAGGGTDTVKSSVSFTLGANVENLTLTGRANINAYGNSGANVLTGNAGHNTLDGGAGADTMIGGAGNDTYFVDNIGDKVIEKAGEGTDTVRASVSFTLGANVENLTLTGSANISGTGNSAANVLTGNSGNNLLDGGAGNDRISGGAGNDTLKGGLGNDVLTGGAGQDTFVFDTALNARTNVDKITDFSVIDDVIHLDNAVFTALTATGVLADKFFAKNTTGLAQDANDHIIYETDTGKLFYDSNGSAAGGSTHFATLQPNLNLTASDFVII